MSLTVERYRFPLAPLLRLVGAPRIDAGVTASLGVDRAQLYRWQRSGLSEKMADRLACRAGYHPGEIWPQWWETA